jgi:multidrug efflux pump subunit AcrB
MDGRTLRDYAQSNWKKCWRGCRAWVKWKASADSMPCGSGSIPTSWSIIIDHGRCRRGLRAYNVEVSAGQFGGAPAVEGQRLNASIVVQNLLKTPEEFAAIPLRTNPDGSMVRVRDVGRTELGTERYEMNALYNGRPNAALAIRQAAGANALDTADAVKATMAE